MKANLLRLKRQFENVPYRELRLLYFFPLVAFTCLFTPFIALGSAHTDPNVQANLYIIVANNDISGILTMKFSQKPQIAGKRTFILLPFRTDDLAYDDTKIRLLSSPTGSDYTTFDIFEAQTGKDIDIRFHILPSPPMLNSNLFVDDCDQQTDFLHIQRADNTKSNVYKLCFRYDTQTSDQLFSDNNSDFTDFVKAMIIPKQVTIEFGPEIRPYLLENSLDFSNIYANTHPGTYIQQKNQYVTSIEFYQDSPLWITYILPAPTISITTITIFDAVVVIGALASGILNLAPDIASIEVRAGGSLAIVIIIPFVIFLLFRSYPPDNFMDYYTENHFSVVTAVAFYLLCLGLFCYRIPAGFRFLKSLWTRQPSQTPGQPSQTPGQPSQTPGQPSQTPGQSSQTPGQSSQTPGQSSH